ncbi:hypothetical protein PIB30_094150 [Stylosanthes scabra]|uniref:Ubiquitin-like protease family profile domain-containing protein n=1 Tax=Stylosanthes scabra TaxID=79078 RepID=A0ABU6QWI6_9FABA|nr:hypothetical protein [Stylosanthes scabra]
MGLNGDEVAIASYLYGNLSHKVDEDIVFSNVNAGRQEFKSLMPGNAIDSKVFDMTYSLGCTNIIPKYVAAKFNNIHTGKVDYLKRAFILVSEHDKDGHEHWYLVVIDRAGVFILLEPRPIETQFKRKRNAGELAIFLEKMLEDRYYYEFETTPNFSTDDFRFRETEFLPKLDVEANDSGLWVASWMIGCYDNDDFDIKVNDGTRMKIAVSLVLKDHNIINQTIISKAKKNLEQLDEDHNCDSNYAY